MMLGKPIFQSGIGTEAVKMSNIGENDKNYSNDLLENNLR